MQKLNIQKTRDLIQIFDLSSLFINQLGWNNPQSQPLNINESQAKPIAQLGGITVFEITAKNFPNAQQRADSHKQISAINHENLLIFLDKPKNPSKSIWYWHNGKQAREHYYFQGQTGDLFISKLSALFVELSELEKSSGDLSILQASEKLKQALDIETITKKFYQDFQTQHLAFLKFIQGIDSERDKHWYASIILNRLMFIWFLQKKGFLDKGNMDYLPDKLKQCQTNFYQDFLSKLFFQGFAKPKEQRSPETNALLGEIRYLNGGLFLKHPLEERYEIQI